MTTFTLRASEELAGRLSSAEMRSWLSDFLRQPHTLPPDPGSGYGRVSLTLPEGVVRAVVEHSQCAVSPALRRIAIERLGIAGRDMSECHGPLTPTFCGSQDRSSEGAAMAAFLVPLVICVLLLGVYLVYRRKTEKKDGHDTEGAQDIAQLLHP